MTDISPLTLAGLWAYHQKDAARTARAADNTVQAEKHEANATKWEAVAREESDKLRNAFLQYC